MKINVFTKKIPLKIDKCVFKLISIIIRTFFFFYLLSVLLQSQIIEFTDFNVNKNKILQSKK